MAETAASSRPKRKPLGFAWEIATTEDAVEVTRPDGRTVTVPSNGTTAVHILDAPGSYTAGDQTIEAR